MTALPSSRTVSVPRLALRGAAAVLAVLAIHFAAPAPGDLPGNTLAAQRLVYWGAYVAGGQYGLADAPWNMQSAARFEATTGKRLSLLEWGQAWSECDSTCGLQGFPTALMSTVRAHGALPVLSWGSYAAAKGATQPAFRLSAIIAGRYDDFIRRWAIGARDWGHPFFLRFDWEMNTNGVPYSEHANGNRPGEFVRMWRHVHRIFAEVGARNVTWVWCPNIEYPGSVQPLTGLYPGAADVDWVGLDGYNWGETPTHASGWTPFAAVFRPTYDLLTTRIAPGKPLMIGETASSELGGSKAAWIRNAFGTEIPADFPRIDAVVWFNKHWSGADWPIESSPAASAALRAALRTPTYLAGGLGRAPAGPIEPAGFRASSLS